MRLSYRNRFILLFVAFGAIVVSSSLLAYYLIESRNIREAFFRDASAVVSEKHDRLERFFWQLSQTAVILGESDRIGGFLRGGGDAALAQETLKTVALVNPELLEIAVRSARSGQLKVWRSAPGAPVSAALEPAAQTRLLGAEPVRVVQQGDRSLIVSAFELPVGEGGASLSLQLLIDSLDQLPYGDVHLADETGRLLIYNSAPVTDGKAPALQTLYPKEAEDMLFSDIFIGKSMYARRVAMGEDRGLYIILQMREALIEEKKRQLWLLMAALIVPVVLLSIPLAHLFSLHPDRLNRELAYLAHHDPMTGLYNRRYFFEAAAKMAGPKAVAILDIDFFKKVNDTYGHDAGDAVIKTVAAQLNDHFGRDALVARFGGEEFCVLLPGADVLAAKSRFEALRASIEGQKTQGIACTISIGVACGDEGNLDAQIKRADELLYQAKEGGRNRVIIEG